jgi:hypothetical protein
MITDSRVKDGTLTLGTTPADMDFSCQVTNVRVNSSYDDDGDTVETLCGDVLAAGRKLGGRSLAGTFIQDWTAAAGESITDYVWTHDLEEMAFTYTPNADGPTLTGTVRLEVPGETYGGDVNSRLTSDFEWQCTAPVVRTPPVAAMAASTQQSASTPDAS